MRRPGTKPATAKNTREGKEEEEEKEEEEAEVSGSRRGDLQTHAFHSSDFTVHASLAANFAVALRVAEVEEEEERKRGGEEERKRGREKEKKGGSEEKRKRGKEEERKRGVRGREE